MTTWPWPLTFQTQTMSLLVYPKIIPYTKFEYFMNIRFWLMLRTNKQTNKQTDELKNPIHADRQSQRGTTTTTTMMMMMMMMIMMMMRLEMSAFLSLLTDRVSQQGLHVSSKRLSPSKHTHRLRRKRFRRDSEDCEVRCEGVHPLCGALSRRRLNPIKLAYDLRRPDGRPNSDQRL